jgi:opacity protein-like surface antigen
MGIYVKAHYPIDELLNIYGMVGKTKLKYSESSSYTDPDPFFSYSGSYSENEQDTTLGLGLEYAIKNANSPIVIGAEYTSYYDKDDISVDGLSLSVLFEL